MLSTLQSLFLSFQYDIRIQYNTSLDRLKVSFYSEAYRTQTSKIQFFLSF